MHLCLIAGSLVLSRPCTASEIGSYMNDVRSFVESNKIHFLKVWDGKSFRDIKGNRHPFETNPNTLYRLNSAGRNSFDEFYRIIT